MSSAGSQIDAWLKEGLKLFGQGHNALALEQWYRVLDIDPSNARALDYIALVREHFRADMTGGAEPFAVPPPTPIDEEAMPPPAIVAPAPAVGDVPWHPGASDAASAGAGASWSELVDVAPAEPFKERVSVARTRYASYDEPAPVAEPAAPVAEPSPVAPPEETADNPWDLLDGTSPALDLDRQPSAPSIFDLLLAGASDAPSSGPSELQAPDEPALVVDASGATDLVPVDIAGEASEAPEPAPKSECDALMEGARELFALGDFSGSLELVEKVLSIEPENAEAQAYLSRNEATLLKMYESKLGSLQRAPKLTTSPDEVIWMNLHHRSGFLLSQIDGELTYEDLAAVSGMSRLETFRILAELVQNGVIA